MGLCTTLLLLCASGMGHGFVPEVVFDQNRLLARTIVEAIQDTNFDRELLFDLKKENQIYVNRTMSLIIKYIVKREVDNYRSRRTDAISRRIYSSLVMKLIDIAKDLPRNASATSRIDRAHRYYLTVENKDAHDQMADIQVFHSAVRLYEVMDTQHIILIYRTNWYYLTVENKPHNQMTDIQVVFHSVMNTAPKIISQLGRLDDLTPRILVRKLTEMGVKPVHLGIALLIQYHLRSTVNFALTAKALDVLSTKPQMVGRQVVEMLKSIASRLLPVSELLDLHLAHSSSVFSDDCPNTWLGIVNKKLNK